MYLLLLNGQDAHGAGPGTKAAGDALGGGAGSRGKDHDMHGAGLHTFAAGGALGLVDHVHALGVLGDSALRAGAGALAAHDAVVDLGLAVRLGDNADAAQVRIKGLVKRLGAGTHTAQACLAGILFADNQFFHMRKASYRLK